MPFFEYFFVYLVLIKFDEVYTIKIANLISGGPAWKGGELKAEDEIIKVAQGSEEPVDVTGYSVTDAVKIIRGAKKGSEVRLTVRRLDGSVKVIPIIRDEIKEAVEKLVRGIV